VSGLMRRNRRLATEAALLYRDSCSTDHVTSLLAFFACSFISYTSHTATREPTAHRERERGVVFRAPEGISAHFPYFEKMKTGLFDLHAVCKAPSTSE
jgi:hypothetical protein